MFSSVLIANRGEIALRAIRTLRRLGIRSVAVYADSDRNSAHVREADTAIALGGVRPADSYLRIDKLIAACHEAGAQAVFPGYGFLSESAEFAEACEAAGLAFLGPTPLQIREFGLKHRSRELAAQAGVPLTPGTGLLSSLEEALQEADCLRYPLMLKSTAGGGGIGLSRCDSPQELTAAYESVQRLGQQFFREAGIFLERYVDRARHIEVQILGDGEGRIVALGERDCSIQRRNQKVVEETPAPNLDAATRSALLEAAVKLGTSVNYRSAGTVEFIYDTSDNQFYFLEVNTRLQVEHPVTEMVTGIDLVECMLLVAAREPLDWDALTRKPQGASIEVRIYAEDPAKNFQPSPGTLAEVHFPAGIRVDGWVETGTEVSSNFDPMLAKLIAHGTTREEARTRLAAALEATRLHGIETNLDFLRRIIASETFVTGISTTRFLDTFTYQPSAIEVLEPGTYTTVQDYPGRTGYWDIGVPPSGPMDDEAFRIANRIVGNTAQAAALECTLIGPTLRFHSDAVIALTGAVTFAKLNGAPIKMWTPVSVQAGQVLAVGQAISGCRTYLAVRSGFDVPIYLGSKSTFVLGAFGGHAGRTLRAGDMLRINDPALAASTTPAPSDAPQPYPTELIPAYTREWEIAVLYGPHGAPDYFTVGAIDEFFAASWEVHHNSNRLGVRLIGPKPTWTRSTGGEAGLHPSNVHDCEYAVGSINFTGDSPVILTHDGPSLGGFVCPVTIIKAELWKVGQIKPGDRIRFTPVHYDDALKLEAEQEARIRTLQPAPKPTPSRASLTTSFTSSATILAQRSAVDHHPKALWRQAGDRYILLEYGEDVLDLALRLRVHLLMEAIRVEKLPVEELSPGVRSLQIRYDSHRIQQPDLMRHLQRMEETLPNVSTLKIPTRVIHLPMAFEDSATLGAIQRYSETVRFNAPWLPRNVEFLRRINGLDSVEAVRDIIYATRYMVLGLGDVYLGAPCAVPVDPRHRLLSSKYNPARSFTAEGTVGIGGMYMCIYGMDSPGGYQLVGRTLPIWNKFLTNSQFEPAKPWLLRFFDQVRFYPVEEAELLEQREAFRMGRHSIRIENETFDYAAHRRFLVENSESIDAFRIKQQAAFELEIAHWANQETTAATNLTSTGNFEEISIPEGDQLAAPMHGSIWKVLVEPGQRVEEDQVVLIIEAMKMEVAVRSPKAGVVKAVLCTSGQSVATGDILAVLNT
ncbi:urea carboxylase [Granulicella arctica]|uniref:Urea carboxylase n=1 Tax=Granulicella arctica TaxID=940613 RepID=A0A7Y9PKH9_9BACT|nr:urea carboxylase [Granulicella arctica]NYF80796.1 urea carboxylase [Granulicella arctica]